MEPFLKSGHFLVPQRDLIGTVSKEVTVTYINHIFMPTPKLKKLAQLMPLGSLNCSRPSRGPIFAEQTWNGYHWLTI
jgi:hypothetical protein